MVDDPRHDGRAADELRPVRIDTDFIAPADGSCLIRFGATQVICTASVADAAPDWLAGAGKGWVTAEYGMLPASTGRRKSRPIAKPDSRATEIQRLIGRVLRNSVALEALGERTVHLDCDVIAADGGTRTAAITGAQVALARALAKAAGDGRLEAEPTLSLVAAVSVGVVGGRCVLDLDYAEDSRAEVDMNVAIDAAGRYVEIQGSAEGGPFDGAQLDALLGLARAGCRNLLDLQVRAIDAPGPAQIEGA
jgi:ribonuclease PH